MRGSCPKLGMGVSGSDRQRYFVGGNRLLKIVSTVATSAHTVDQPRIVLGLRPIEWRGMACTDHQCSLIARDRLLQILSAVTAWPVGIGKRQIVLRLRPAPRKRFELPEYEHLLVSGDGTLDIVSTIALLAPVVRPRNMEVQLSPCDVARSLERPCCNPRFEVECLLCQRNPLLVIHGLLHALEQAAELVHDLLVRAARGVEPTEGV